MAHTIDKFYPRTNIIFCDTGIDENNKPYFTSNSAMVAWLRTKIVTGTRSITDASFQRDMGGFPIRVDHDDAEYQALLQCDTVAWTNLQENYHPRWMVAHITSIEWKNPNCSFVHYEIDWFTSFVDCIDWDSSICYIEREHVKQDWNGTTPMFQNCGVPEGMSFDADYRIGATDWQMYNNNDLDYVVVAPYDKGANINFSDTTGLRRYCGLTMNVFQSKAEVSAFLNTIAKDFYPTEATPGSLSRANISNIVGIFTRPRANKGGKATQEITPPWVTAVGYRNAKCWHGDFNKFRLHVPMADQVIDFTPEYIGNSYTSFTLERELDSDGDEFFMRVTPLSQRFSEGRIPNADMSVFIKDAPQGAWVGDQFAQWKAVQGFPSLVATGLSITSTMGKLNARNAINAGQLLSKSKTEEEATAQAGSNYLSAISDIGKNLVDQFITWGKAAMNGTTVGGTAFVGTNNAFEHYGFTAYVYFYQASPTIMSAIDNYFDRFGYLVNTMRAPNPTNRPRWYYCKCLEAHIADKGGQQSIGSLARTSIEGLLSRGVTIFRTDSGVNIGDFSNPAGNKAQ